MGVAIAKGILKTLGIEYKTTVAQAAESVSNKAEDEASKLESGAKPLYRVQVGAFADLNNADNMLKRLEAAGFEGFIVCNK